MGCNYIFKGKKFDKQGITEHLLNNHLNEVAKILNVNIQQEATLSEIQKSVLRKTDLDKDGNITPQALAEIQAERERIVSQAKANGTYMKAPNGKPTNLNQEQWVAVRTSRFKDWFGDWESASLIAMAEKTWNGDTKNWTHRFSPSEKLSSKLKELLGKDITSIAITDSAVRHIKKQHGQNESNRGQRDYTPKDIAVLPYIINNFDTAEISTPDRKGNQTIELKKITNGVTSVITVTLGDKKEFVVTSWQEMSSASMKKSLMPNALDDLDLAKVQKDIEQIKSSVENSSKVVDENGEPLVVYHKTSAKRKFNTFNTESSPSWFTPFKNYANAFGTDKGKMYATFINSKNSLFVGDIDGIANHREFERLSRISDIPIETLKDILNESRGVNIFNITNSGRFKSILSEKGIDGIEAKEGRGLTTYGIFHSNQIKSATDNVGTYSEDSNDIRYHINENSDLQNAKILQGEAVAKLNSENAPKGGLTDVTNWALEIFNQWGNKALNKDLGEIVLNKKAIKDSLAHGNNITAKKIAFQSIKDVIEKGAVIHSERKGNHNSFYISAPIEIDGERTIATVLVRKDANTQRMYLHSVTIESRLKDLRVNKSKAEHKSEQNGSTGLSSDIAKILNNLLNYNTQDINYQIAGSQPDNNSKSQSHHITEQKAKKLDHAQETTHRIDNLSVAKAMEIRGKNPQDILFSTGWQRGADGKCIIN